MTNVVPLHNQLGQPAEDVAKEAPDDLVLWSAYNEILGNIVKAAA